MVNDSSFTLLREKKLLDTPWLKVTANDYQLPNQQQLHEYYVVQEKNGVTVVPLTTNNEILIVKQFRPPINEMCYDLPGGLIDAEGIDPLLQAQQELLQETGYATKNWISIGSFYPAPHRLRNFQECYIAKDITKIATPKLDNTEVVTYELVDLNIFEQMIKENIFKCSYCITAYFKAKLSLGI
ncbi:MAG TPA: NUDIX hydrolase [Vitreimonas sp.]|nr:NUDIX hydrolase [Vitreimonas sp.]